MKRKHIAIIGASFAGLSSLLVLRKRLGDTIQISLLDKESNFTYIPALHETLFDSEALSGIQFSLSKYYPEFKQAEVKKITKNNKVITETGEKILFDYAVIATGSRTQYFGKEDFEKNTYSLRRAKDVEPINKALKKAKDICVIGGGYTGIEIAAMIARRKRPEQRISLIHSRDRLVHTYKEHISEMAQKRLIKNNVHLQLGDRAKEITPHQIILDSGKIVASDCSILSSGIKINDEPHAEELNFDLKDIYSAKENDTIFRAGDVAIHGLMTTAHNAMIEGRRIGHLIADNIEGKTTSYKPLENRTILAMALGTKDGIITNGEKMLPLPLLTGLAKKFIEKRIMFEFTRRVMLWI